MVLVKSFIMVERVQNEGRKDGWRSEETKGSC